MAGVNWTKYGCDLCRMIGLVAAAVAAALVAWILSALGVGPVWVVLLWLIVWAALGLVVDNFCEARTVPPTVVEPAGMRPESAGPVTPTVTMSEDARAADEGARAAAAEERAAAEAEASHAEAMKTEPAGDVRAEQEAEREAAEEAERRAEEEAAEARAREAAEREAERAENKAEIAAAVVNERMEQFDDQFENREDKRTSLDTEPPAEDRPDDTEREAAAAAESGEDAAITAAREAAGEPERAEDSTPAISGEKPDTLDAPRDGGADDLRKIKGIGPKIEAMLNEMGVYHFDQIANWTDAEIAWVDDNLEGFKGRATRDDWIEQAKILAAEES